MAVAAIHYISALVTGIVLRIAASSRKNPAEIIPSDQNKTIQSRQWLFTRSLSAMQEARLRDGRTFGKLLGDAVTSSIQTLMMIAGYMMIFSVMLNALTLSRIASAVEYGLSLLLSPLGVPLPLISTLIASAFDVHLGAFGISQAETGNTLWKAVFLGIA